MSHEPHPDVERRIRFWAPRVVAALCAAALLVVGKWEWGRSGVAFLADYTTVCLQVGVLYAFFFEREFIANIILDLMELVERLRRHRTAATTAPKESRTSITITAITAIIITTATTTTATTAIVGGTGGGTGGGAGGGAGGGHASGPVCPANAIRQANMGRRRSYSRRCRRRCRLCLGDCSKQSELPTPR